MRGQGAPPLLLCRQHAAEEKTDAGCVELKLSIALLLERTHPAPK